MQTVLPSRPASTYPENTARKGSDGDPEPQMVRTHSKHRLVHHSPSAIMGKVVAPKEGEHIERGVERKCRNYRSEMTEEKAADHGEDEGIDDVTGQRVERSEDQR